MLRKPIRLQPGNVCLSYYCAFEVQQESRAIRNFVIQYQHLLLVLVVFFFNYHLLVSDLLFISVHLCVHVKLCIEKKVGKIH